MMKRGSITLALLLFIIPALCTPHHHRRDTHGHSIDARAIIHARDPAPDSDEGPDRFLFNNAATIFNSCPYTVYVRSTPGPGCPPSDAGGSTTNPGTIWKETAANCRERNTSLKIYKEDTPQSDGNEPLQIEYGKGNGDGKMWYNLSFINCARNNGTDLSGCVGWDGGIQMKSNGGCQTITCEAKGQCCVTGYCDPDGSQARGPSGLDKLGTQPVVGCTPEDAGTGIGHHTTSFEQLGVAIELCAEQK
jgi:hypothetical protein